MVRRSLCLVQVLLAMALQAELPEPLVLFDMDEMSGATIANSGTAEGADLTVSSKCSLTDRSVSGKSLFFGGIPGKDGSYATFACPELKNRTVAFWMFRENAVSPAHAEDPIILPWLLGGASRLQIRLEESASPQLGNDAFVPYIGTGNGTYMRGCTAAHRGAWVHLAITIAVESENVVSDSITEYVYDWKVYANGILSYAGSKAVATNIVSEGVYYLGNITAKHRPFYGSIDDFRIYGEPLGDAQVWELFSSGADTVSTARLIGHWPMDEWSDAAADGFTTPDISGYGKNLELSAMASKTNGVDGNAVHFGGKSGSYAKVKIPKECSSSTWAFWMRQSPDSENLKNGMEKNSPRLVYEPTSKFSLIMDVGHDSRRFVYQLQNTNPSSKAISPPAAVVHQGVWQHVVFVNRGSYDETIGKFAIKPELWINGAFSGSGEVEYSDVFKLKQNSEVSFGTQSNNAFEGEFDDIRIYSGALTSNEIVRLYRSVVPVAAPDDFTFAGEDCVLAGAVAGFSGGDYRTGFNGSFSWSTVSAPEGAEPVFGLKNNLVTPVSLPIEGEYVFRLSSKDAFGGEKYDEVTVIRDDSSKIDPPAAPAEDSAMAEALSDATVSGGIDEGLIRYWSGAGKTPEKTLVDGSTALGIGWRDSDLNRIAPGGGIAPYAFDFGDFTKGAGIGETTEKADSSGGNSAWPADEWRTFSLWMYQDSEKNYLHYSPCIVSARTTLWINLNRYDNPKTDGKIQDSGIMIIQTGGIRTSASAAQSKLWFKAPFSFTNRWTHLVAMINRHDSSKIELYLDGVKRTPDSSSIGKVNVEGQSHNSGGRVQGHLYFGGIDYNALDYSSQSNALYSVAHDPNTGEFYSRTFPGKLTDIRLYNRRLSDAEVGYLFRHPGIAFNRAPVVGAASASKPVVKRKPASLSVSVQDDGNPGIGTSYEWVVVKGDASKVSFADPNAKVTTATVKEAGVYAFSLKCTDGERTTYAMPVEFTVANSGTVLTIR